MKLDLDLDMYKIELWNLYFIPLNLYNTHFHALPSVPESLCLLLLSFQLGANIFFLPCVFWVILMFNVIL